MGIQETTMRAAVAEMIPAGQRGLAYGIFNTAYGTAWFVGSSLMGVLYGIGIGIHFLILFAVLLEAISLPILLLVQRSKS